MNPQYCVAEDAAAKVIFVELPIDHYNGFVQKCETWRGEFEILKNAVVVDGSDGKKKAEFLCNLTQAGLLRDLAAHIYPLATVYIDDSIKSARQP
jgi:hypothetical protein